MCLMKYLLWVALQIGFQYGNSPLISLRFAPTRNIFNCIVGLKGYFNK